MNKEKIVSLLLQIAIAFSFFYAAIAGYTDPDSWIGYFPTFMRGIIPDTTLLNLFGLYEIILGLWIISGKKIFIPSIIAALNIFGIVLFNFSQLDVLFRDISIALSAVALAVLSLHNSDRI